MSLTVTLLVRNGMRVVGRCDLLTDDGEEITWSFGTAAWNWIPFLWAIQRIPSVLRVAVKNEEILWRSQETT